jgi:hypothetical protein
MQQAKTYETLFFTTNLSTTVCLDIAEGEVKNTLESIIPRVVRGYGDEYKPEDYTYEIIVGGKVFSENTKIKDFIGQLQPFNKIIFRVKLKPEPNKWQALSLEKFTSMPTALINIITSYSAVRPSRSSFFYSINLNNHIKSNLSILFKVFRSQFSQYAGRMTATELLQQLDNSEIQHILDAKGIFTPLAQQLITRIETNEIKTGSETKEDVKQLANNVLSLVSTGRITSNTPSTEKITDDSSSNTSSCSIM